MSVEECEPDQLSFDWSNKSLAYHEDRFFFSFGRIFTMWDSFDLQIGQKKKLLTCNREASVRG